MKQTLRTVGISLLAAGAGAGLALLLAPRSGERTRRLIRYKAGSYAKDLREGVSTGAAALYLRGAEGTRRALKRLGKTLNPLAA